MRWAVAAVVSILLGRGQAELKPDSPITRVVELIDSLSKKISADQKAEQALYDKYECWCKTVLATKKASNAEAKNSIEALTAYIDDVGSGRVEFTSERKDLEAEVAQLNTAIEKAQTLRNQQHEDFLAAKEEMEQAITALSSAISVLGDATAASGSASLAALSASLRRASALGRRTLSASDAKMLDTALAAPEVDWAKLVGAKAGGAQYKASSGKIQGLLNNMLSTFQDNLGDALKTEKDAVAQHDALMGAKQSQLSAAEDALGNADEEEAAKEVALEESREKLKGLTEQVTNDERFIGQTEKGYSQKEAEWRERKKGRAQELAALSKAKEVLTSDDARDTLRRSFKSQHAFMFLQEDSPQDRALDAAVAKLQELAATHGRPEIAALATSARLSRAGGHLLREEPEFELNTTGTGNVGRFDAIIRGIDQQVSDLWAEGDADWDYKEKCLDDRSENTKDGKRAARDIDERTEDMARLDQFIAELNRDIAEFEQRKKELRQELADASEQRKNEQIEFQASKADDRSAIGTIERAMDVLKTFYDESGALALAQGRSMKRRLAEPVEAGQAPGPPPSTWSAPVEKAKGEGDGIQAILAMIRDDVEKDIRTATAEENRALKDYNALVDNTKKVIKKLDGQQARREASLSGALEDRADAAAARLNIRSQLQGNMDYLRSIAEGCDAMMVDFSIRKRDREEEITGLYDAKAMLLRADEDAQRATEEVEELAGGPSAADLVGSSSLLAVAAPAPAPAAAAMADP